MVKKAEIKKQWGKIHKYVSEFLSSSQKIVSRVYEIDRYCDYPFFYQYATDYSPVGIELSANGISREKKVAYDKAVFETVERWSLCKYDVRTFIYDSYRNLLRRKLNAINPKLFNYFSSRQLKKEEYAAFRFNENTKFSWIRAINLIDKSKILIPAQLVYFLSSKVQVEPKIRLEDAVGAAASSTLEQSIYNGICELIERDAYAITYYNQIPFKKISCKNITDKQIKYLLDFVKQYLFEINLYDITLDIKVPTILCLLVDQTKKGPPLSIGLKCDVSYITAIEGALLESIQNLNILRDLYLTKKNVTSTEFKKIILNKKNPIITRLTRWLDKKSLKKLNFLIKAGFQTAHIPTSNIDKTVRSKLQYVVKTLSKVGINDLYWVKTSPKSQDKYNICSTKVLIPTLQNIPFHEGYSYLGGGRLYKVPVTLGYFPSRRTEGELHSFPHPLP